MKLFEQCPPELYLKNVLFYDSNLTAEPWNKLAKCNLEPLLERSPGGSFYRIKEFIQIFAQYLLKKAPSVNRAHFVFHRWSSGILTFLTVFVKSIEWILFPISWQDELNCLELLVRLTAEI